MCGKQMSRNGFLVPKFFTTNIAYEWPFQSAPVSPFVLIQSHPTRKILVTQITSKITNKLLNSQHSSKGTIAKKQIFVCFK